MQKVVTFLGQLAQALLTGCGIIFRHIQRGLADESSRNVTWIAIVGLALLTLVALPLLLLVVTATGYVSGIRKH